MEKKRVLLVTNELDPYLAITEIAELVKKIAIQTQDGGMEVRILMPRFGIINERRNRLHEVVRLSGMNIIIDDEDIPLVIKVASLPGARIQVYFLDNDEFFKRKQVFEDDNEKPFDDNAERMVFFCKGVLETVKKFGWAPDIIHCHGWMTSLIPMFIKTSYALDPVFNQAKVIFSLYNSSFDYKLNDIFLSKAIISKEIGDGELEYFNSLDYNGLQAGAVKYADAFIIGTTVFEKSETIKTLLGEKPLMECPEGDESLVNYLEFYKSLVN
jgi:starch synthase